MVYEHKRKIHAKKTKDILAEKVTESKKTEYDEIEVSETDQTGSSLLVMIQKKSNQDTRPEDSEDLSIEAEKEVDAATTSMIAEDCPDYSSTQEIHFESKEAEETFEKKKKRQYVESKEKHEK
ncbi:MAG: hypothetical protein ACTSPR_03115 [Candidatus Thorarchaeota archaeon]